VPAHAQAYVSPAAEAGTNAGGEPIKNPAARGAFVYTEGFLLLTAYNGIPRPGGT